MFWLLPACAALWFLDGFENGFLLNSAIGNHPIFPSGNLFGFIILKQHSKGNKPNIPDFAILNIHSNISDVVLSATATLSTEINPPHSVPVISPASIPSTTAQQQQDYRIPHTRPLGTNSAQHITHPLGTNSAQHIYLGTVDDPGIPWDPPAHTLPYRHDLSQPVCWATVQHLPPLVLTDLVRYSHDSTSSSIKILERQHFF